MKMLRYLAATLVLGTAVCRSQDEVITTNGGWYSMDAIIDLGLTNNSDSSDDGQTVQIEENIQPQTPPIPPAIAEATNTEIQALADGLQDDPLQIYKYVHDHIRYVHYFGSIKGAELTLLEKSGNDFDQCALLVALLRAAGYTNAGYEFGWMLLPYDNTDGSDRDLHHWLDLDLTNSPSTWSTTTGFLDYMFKQRSYPITEHNWGNNLYAMQRVWVTVTVVGTNYTLDPSFKVTERIPGINLLTAMGFTLSGLTNAIGGQDIGNLATAFYATNLNEANLRGTLAGYTTNLLGYIQGNFPNDSVSQILSGEYIVPATNTTLGNNLLFSPTNLNGSMPVTNWVNQPTNMMSTFAISYQGTKYQWLGPQLQGQRLSLTISSSGTAQLWQEDDQVASASTGGTNGVFNLTITTYYPGFESSWNTTSNTFLPGPAGQVWESITKTYQNLNASYAILYAYDPDWGWLQERQRELDAYRQTYADTSRQVVTETLNIMGLDWQLQEETMSRILARQIGVSTMYYQRIGRMAQESGYGYYVDVYMAEAGSTSSSSQSDGHSARWVDEVGYFGSAMEHGLIEQLQATNLIGASTVKILELANTNHEAVYLGNSTNWTAVSSKLVNYSTTSLNSIYNSYLAQGWSVLLPQNGRTEIAGAGSWTGYGLLLENPAGVIGMLIGDSSGVHSGGYVSDLSATVSPSFIDYSSYTQPLYFNSAPVSVFNVTAADPVDMADGTFQAGNTDLTLGQMEPRGLSFSRYYNSSRRNSNLAGLAPGWLHNYYLNAATISAPQTLLGGSTPAQMASMTVALTAANQVYNPSPADPRNWMTVALIAKWGIDQITARAVSVSLGESTVQFIQQPDGSFTPPANSTMTLLQTNGAYRLQERHGRAFTFNGAGWATNISDQYGQSLTLAYNSSNWVASATDWKGRTLTFNYSSTAPKRLLSVADDTARSVSFGYSSGNDLISITDPEGKTSTFLYDTNHQIIVSSNAVGQVVVSNVFNSFGRVTTQYTEGSLSNAWHIFWSGWQTIAQDPAGGQTTYSYDDQTRLIAQQDALGNLTQSFYDGQNHVINTVSPLNETSQFIYDGNNNLVQTIDPLNNTNQFFYDGNNNLVEAVDSLGNPRTFGYNAQFSIIGETNAALDWVSYAYNGDGTLASRTDVGGVTQYGYDSFGQLMTVTYPNNLGSITNFNSYFGDVTNHVNGRGFAVAFQYNNRRQLTNTIAPTNVTISVSFDAVGNVASTTDARTNVTSETWSPTRHLLAATLPAVPQGTPVLTNGYDVRDWLVRSADALGNAALYTNDLDGRLASATDPIQRTARFPYDNDGRTLTSANAGNETNSQTWDARGKMIQLTDGAGHVSTRIYDAAGNQIVLTNRNAHAWQFQFDKANRLTAMISPLGYSNAVVFNHQGLPASMTDAAGQTTTLGYDAKGRLISRADNVGTNIYNYDADDNPTSVIANNQTNAWTYDAYDRISSYQDINTNLIQYRYDANGNLTNLVYPGGKNVFYTYDTLNRMTGVTDWSGRKSSITYDLDSRITSITRPNGSYRTISYDTAGQATNIMEQMGNSLPIAIFKYAWANTGTMAWEFAAPLPHTNAPPTRTMTYDNDNRLLTVDNNNVTMNSDGNLVNGPLTNDTFAVYTFDARNRLLSAGGITNTYDALDNRVKQAYGTTVITFVVNPNASLPVALMRIKNGITNYYIYGPGLLYQITETTTGTNTLTYHYDYRGSTIALSADNGLVTDRMEYSLYATLTYRVGTNETPFLFNGKYGVQTDPNSLLYMRARYYNSFLCRFLNPDPSGFGGGLNMFAYASGNPVSYLDPFGLGAVGENSLPGWFTSNNHFLIDQYFSQQSVNFDDIVNGLLGLADDVASLPWDVAMGTAGQINTLLSGQDAEGNDVSGWDRALAGAEVAATFVPLLGEATVGLDAVDEAADAGITVASSGGGDILPATFVRQIQQGESVSDLIDEVAQLTYESGGQEHAIVSLQSGDRVIVSGGTGGIDFSGMDDLNRIILHTHPAPTGPSAIDFNMLQQTGQQSSWIYELYGGGLTKFHR